MLEKRPFTNLYHPDVAVFLILIPFISAFNYYLTYSNIQFSLFLFGTFALDTIQGYFAWWAVRHYIFFLDKRLSFEKGFLRRVIIQLFGSLLIGLFIISTLTELASWIVKGKAAVLDFYTTDLFIISIWFFVITGIYIGLRYYNLWQRSEATRQEENRNKLEGLVVKQGKQEIRLNFDELAGFFVDDDYAVACHMSGKKYYMGQSLDKIEKTLPSGIFFRLNRQFILHSQMISGFSRSENGKILVIPHRHESFPSEILISRTKAPSFKAWFRPEA